MYTLLSNEKALQGIVGKFVVSDALRRLRDQVEAEVLPPFVCVYPTRSAYVPTECPASLAALWEEDQSLSGNDLNLYVHVPFCGYKCGFCNLYTTICTEPLQHARYIQAVCRQLRWQRAAICNRRVRTLYIGGGTPTLLAPQLLERLLTTLTEVRSTWRSEVEEVAIEASPDSLAGPSGVDYAMRLTAMGIDRVNLGVQSLRPRELREMGRGRAGPDSVAEAVNAVRTAGVRNLSMDLIIGFDGQTDETWLESVEGLLSFRPDTISTYFLTVRPDAWFARTGRYYYERDRALYRRYDAARDRLGAAGYTQESNVRYVLPCQGGYRQKTLQFAGVPVLGLGAGARSYNNTNDYLVGGGAYPSFEQIDAYIADVTHGELRPRSGFVMNGEERIRRRLVLGLRDLPLSELERMGGEKWASSYTPILEAAIELGLIEVTDGNRCKLTGRGLRHGDVLSWMFFSEKVRDRDSRFYAGLDASMRARSPSLVNSKPGLSNQ